MASVYEATDLRLDRTVAVKVMHPGLGDDDEFAARFVREARAAARLSHPNVVAVYDQGDDDGTVFLAMECVPGPHAARRDPQGGPMSPARALALLEPVLSALAAAHRAGLIHRDVKPENVLIADDGRVKVADFGLAKAVSADTQHTATGGVLIGTVSYLAPELVVDGRSDARADVYAVGRDPLRAAHRHASRTRASRRSRSPTSTCTRTSRRPRGWSPGIPAYVDALVARATARDRDQRPADAGVLLHQLHRVAQALPDGVREDPELTADLAPPRRHARHRRVERRGEPRTTPSPSPSTRAEFAAPDGTAASTAPRRRARPAGPPRRPPARCRARRRSPASRTARRPRRSRRGPLLLVLALLLAAAAGVGAWWFGWERYTSTPGVLGHDARPPPRRSSRPPASTSSVGDPAVLRDRAGRARRRDRPAAGARCSTAAPSRSSLSLGKERYDVPKHARPDRGRGPGRAPRAPTSPSASRSAAGPRPCPRAPSLRSDPAAGHPAARHRRRPRRQQGPQADHGQGLDRQGRRPRPRRALERKGFEVTVAPRSTPTPSPRATSSPRARPTAPSSAATGHASWSRRAPSWSRCPAAWSASGVDAARASLEALGFEVEIEHVDNYLGLGFVYSRRPRLRHRAPQGLHGHALARSERRLTAASVARMEPAGRSTSRRTTLLATAPCSRSPRPGAARSS